MLITPKAGTIQAMKHQDKAGVFRVGEAAPAHEL